MCTDHVGLCNDTNYILSPNIETACRNISSQYKKYILHPWDSDTALLINMQLR